MIAPRGVKAFQRPRHSSNFSASVVRQVTLTRGGRELRAVSYCDGPWELYVVRDGLEQFAGYASEALPRLVGGKS